MDVAALQRRLQVLGLSTGVDDGIYGPKTRAAVLEALSVGNDNKLSDLDIEAAAVQLQVTPAHIKAVWVVEAAGAGFVGGLPKILFEPHRFSKATRGRFDRDYPQISYPQWDKSRYPKSQGGRYDQLLTAIGLDADAGFASASYGAFQILGENYAICGYPSPWAFALAQSQSEGDQLEAFLNFVQRVGLVGALRKCDWEVFARGYNGTAYRQNRYHERLAEAYVKAGGK